MKNIVIACVALLVASALALDVEHKAKITAIFLAGGIKCLRTHRLSFADILSIRQKVLPGGDTPKCFSQCLFSELGVMDEMGILKPEGAKGHAMEIFKDDPEHQSKVDKFVKACADEVNPMKVDISDGMKEGCERAKLAFSCFVEKAPKYDFDVDFF